ncbi:reverse transcriptase domain-containing protein [Tanacetum coccineum]
MASQVIEETVLKDQRNPPRTTTEDRKTKTGSPHIEGRTTTCSPICPKVQEKLLPQKEPQKASNYLPRCSEANDHEIPPRQLSHLMKDIKKEKAKSIDTPRGEGKKDKSTTPVEALILMISREDYVAKNTISKSMTYKEEITFPPVTRVINAPVIIEAVFHTKKGVGTILSVGEAGEETKKARRTLTISKERIPSCDDTEEKIIVNDKYPKQMVTIGKHLPKHFKKELPNLLRANADIFIWTHADMTGILRTIMNKQSLGPDCNTAACKEAKKLTKAGILRKVKHQTWVANPFMVKNNDGGWRMCVNFTNINKACPKDCYPLPETDWKIESLAGFHLKCFLDAYKGYHQIQIEEGDEDKTTFFVGEGVFCYRKMSFSLKNAGATYQRLVDKVFSKQIERNLEAYVDDMVIKSTSKEGMLSYTRNLRKVPVDQYEAESEEVLIWYEADKAFKEIKKFVQALPTLTAPRAGETLTMYLAASKESINAMLFSKRSKEQIPIYFISKVLQGAELNYPALEKLILALVHAARRHRRYIQAHTIMVPTVKEKEVSDPSNEWKLYTDGASSPDGAGAGLMLIDPAGKEYTYALRFEFETTNNEAEYEALLAGLRIAQEMKSRKKGKKSLNGFEGYTVEHIRRNQNKNADALSKLASMTFEHLTKEVLVEVLAKRSIEEKEVLKVEMEEKRSWMSPIQEYLLSGLLPEDTKEARKIRIQVPQYKLIRGNMYIRSFFTPWLRCIAPLQTDKIIKEIHEGSCGFNAKPCLMVVRITKQGYYWPSMHREAAKAIQDCDKCKE